MLWADIEDTWRLLRIFACFDCISMIYKDNIIADLFI